MSTTVDWRTVAAPPLATLDDLDALGVTGDPDDLNRLLDAASAAARNYCGWLIGPTQTNTLLHGRHGGKVVTLPTLYLIDVHSVVVDGSTLEAVPAFLQSGVLQTQLPSTFSSCDVVCDHGYNPIPADVSIAVAGMVSRVTAAPAGVAQERLGAWSVSYRDAGVSVDPLGAAALAPYKLAHVP